MDYPYFIIYLIFLSVQVCIYTSVMYIYFLYTYVKALLHFLESYFLQIVIYFGHCRGCIYILLNSNRAILSFESN